MAAIGCVLSEDQLLCPICLDLFNQPISTPCGHNFCRDCIEGYWQIANQSQCPVCKQKFHRWPEFRVNILISEVTIQFKESLGKKDGNEVKSVEQYSGHKGEVLYDVSSEKRRKALKAHLQYLATFRKAHLEHQHVQDTFKKHHSTNPTMNMQDRVCKKHNKPLDLFCHTDQMYVCQICIKKGHGAHHTVPVEDASRDRRAQIGRLTSEVEEMINDRLQKIDEIDQTVQLSKGNTEREIEEGLRVFDKLQQFVQRGQAEVLEEIGAKQRQVESRASRLVVKLKQEIDVLRQRYTELEHLSYTDDSVYLLQNFAAFSRPPVTKYCLDTCMESAVYVGVVRSAVREAAWRIEERVKAEAKRICKVEFQRARQYAVDVTLDPDTAHPKLMVSDDKKQVYHGDEALNLPDNPERFYPGISILGKEGYSSGRFYFEVQVKCKTEWDIGVGLGSVNRKGGNMLNPESGYWVLGKRKDKRYWALCSTPVCVPLVEEPQRVGVFVDMEWGQVSFYNVDTASHIYSFTGHSFNESLFPYFNPRRNHGGLNYASLIILPVNV